MADIFCEINNMLVSAWNGIKLRCTSSWIHGYADQYWLGARKSFLARRILKMRPIWKCGNLLKFNEENILRGFQFVGFGENIFFHLEKQLSFDQCRRRISLVSNKIYMLWQWVRVGGSVMRIFICGKLTKRVTASLKPKRKFLLEVFSISAMGKCAGFMRIILTPHHHAMRL